MKKLEKAVDQYIRDKHSTDECSAYIKGLEDGIDLIDSQMYWGFAIGMVLGAAIIELITLILN
jgi:tetrahydromethanopterin S-methyltransferase subunit B